jgi:glycosyltransferase involved in cell wall biosynthesis
MLVTVLLTAYQRANLLKISLDRIRAQKFKDYELLVVEDGDDGGATRKTVLAHGGRYVQRKRERKGWMNPAIPCNIGFQQAQGEIIVYMCGDIRFTRSADLERLIAPFADGKDRLVMASCRRLRGGQVSAWHLHPEFRVSPLLGVGAAFRKATVCALGGFDESFVGYGAEDGDLLWRMWKVGVIFTILPPEIVWTEHPWHPPAVIGMPKERLINRERMFQIRRDIDAGKRTVVANVGREWGKLC